MHTVYTCFSPSLSLLNFPFPSTSFSLSSSHSVEPPYTPLSPLFLSHYTQYPILLHSPTLHIQNFLPSQPLFVIIGALKHSFPIILVTSSTRLFPRQDIPQFFLFHPVNLSIQVNSSTVFLSFHSSNPSFRSIFFTILFLVLQRCKFPHKPIPSAPLPIHSAASFLSVPSVRLTHNLS